MTKEEFLQHYFNHGSVQEVELERDSDWGCTMNVIIEHEGKHYMGEVTERWGAHVIENYSIFGDPEVVVPRQKVITEYLLPEDALEPSDIDTLIEGANYIMDIALQFTHPEFSESYPEWSAVYSLGESVVDVLSKQSKEEDR